MDGVVRRPRALRSWNFPDELGRYRCRFCDGVCPGRKRSFCSDLCVAEYLVRTDPAYARRAVLARDRGVCALCGRDAEALRLWLCRIDLVCARNSRPEILERASAAIGSRLAEVGFGCVFGTEGLDGHLWEADHVVPVVEGGGGCGLSGLRTLCLPCHKRETAALRRRLKGRDQLVLFG
jgi:5-methylcytosine-specific restriction protein A